MAASDLRFAPSPVLGKEVRPVPDRPRHKTGFYSMSGRAGQTLERRQTTDRSGTFPEWNCMPMLKVFVTTRLSGDRHGRWMPNTRSSDRPICVCGPLCGAQHRDVVERYEFSQFGRARRGGSGDFPIWANKTCGIGEKEHFAFPSNRDVVERAALEKDRPPTRQCRDPRIETTRQGNVSR